MKHIIETGTDVATICFFDPAALPPTFGHAKRDAYEAIAKLAEDNLVWFQETGADGAYLFHFYIDEEVPERILKHSFDPRAIPQMPVPSGAIWACGAEYAARNPEQTLERFSRMGGKCSVPPGKYAVTIWRTEWPEAMIEQELENLGVRGQNRLGVVTSILFLVMLIGSLITFLKTLTKAALNELNNNYAWAWGILILGWTVCVPLMRKLSKLEKNPKRKQVEHEFPSIVVQMRPAAPNSK